MEWLRIIGMLLVFTLHVAEPFNPWDTWHVVNPARSKYLGELVFLLAPWIMPLFMMLAGESAWYALAKRSRRDYVRERVQRIALPLVAGILLVVPPQVYLERRLSGQYEGSFVGFYPHFFEGIYPRGNFSWHHLWFLVLLLLFAIVTLPLFRWLRAPLGRRAMARLAMRCEGPGGLALLVLPAIAIRLGIELAVPSFRPLTYDWSDRALLLPAFVFGFMLAGEAGFERAVNRHWRSAMGIAIAISTALLAWAWPGDVLSRLPVPRSCAGALLWSGYACAAWCWVLALLGGARQYLTRRNEALGRASEMVYPFYVLHQLVIVAVAFVVVQRDVAIPLAFLALGTVSLATTLALCWFVTSHGTLRVLFGLRQGA